MMSIYWLKEDSWQNRFLFTFLQQIILFITFFLHFFLHFIMKLIFLLWSNTAMPCLHWFFCCCSSWIENNLRILFYLSIILIGISFYCLNGKQIIFTFGGVYFYISTLSCLFFSLHLSLAISWVCLCCHSTTNHSNC